MAQNSTASCVEVGSYVGASSACIAAGLDRYGGGSVYCVDTWTNDAMSEGYRDTMAEFLRNTERFSRYIVPLRGLSTDPAVIGHVKRAAQTIDLLFIDGDHSFEGVLADWETYSPLLAELSVIAMHDIGWAEGVQRVVMEEIKPRVVRECRLPNLWWGWVKK
jgi:predicted O-methyltransferase YrrM